MAKLDLDLDITNDPNRKSRNNTRPNYVSKNIQSNTNKSNTVQNRQRRVRDDIPPERRPRRPLNNNTRKTSSDFENSSFSADDFFRQYGKLILAVAGLILLIIIIAVIVSAIKKHTSASEAAELPSSESVSACTISINEPTPVPEPEKTMYNPSEYGLFEGYALDKSGMTYLANEEVNSQYAIIVDAATGKVMAGRNEDSIIPPASMTKMLTLIVAVENIPESELDNQVTITQEDTDYAYRNDLSAVGFSVGEVVTVKDLMYGTILPSGGDAAHALAVYVAGSEEAFAGLMNAKAAELGLKNSHFTNVSGYYGDNHYSTVEDMAVIIKCAMENELCRQVMSQHQYFTSESTEHPEGIDISNWFLRRIEDKYSAGLVYAAKTGYVSKSGNCAASFDIMPSGNQYICVTVNAHSAWRCIFDHVEIYNEYAK